MSLAVGRVSDYFPMVQEYIRLWVYTTTFDIDSNSQPTNLQLATYASAVKPWIEQKHLGGLFPL